MSLVDVVHVVDVVVVVVESVVGGESSCLLLYLGQVLLLLGVITVAVDLVDAQVRVGTVAQGHRARGTGELLHGNGVIQVSKTETTVLGGDSDTEKTHITKLLPHVL